VYRKAQAAKCTRKIQKARTNHFGRVHVSFPKMRTPFATCKAFDASKRLLPLNLHFRDEAKQPELQELRTLLTETQLQISKSIHALDTEHDTPLTVAKQNVFIKPGKAKPNGGGSYTDLVTLKVDPESVAFTTPDGTPLDINKLDLRKVELQPTVWVRDVWKVNDTYYPRLFVDSCIIHESTTPTKPILERTCSFVERCDSDDGDDDEMPDAEESDDAPDVHDVWSVTNS